jgi:hypothetical protein
MTPSSVPSGLTRPASVLCIWHCVRVEAVRGVRRTRVVCVVVVGLVFGGAACSGSDSGGLRDSEAADLRETCEAVSEDAERCSGLVDRIAEIVDGSECASDQAASLLAGALADPAEDYRDTSDLLLDCDL